MIAAATALSVFLLACLVMLSWGVFRAWREALRLAPEPAPETRGATLDWPAPLYDGWCTAIGLGRNFREETLRHADLRPGEAVLDVGCGTGVLTRMAAGKVGPAGKAAGVDPAPAMIGLARRKAALEKSQAEYRLAAIEGLPFIEESFDAALASLMLHHLPPDVKRAGLREVFRVLKPGARLVVVDFDRPASAFARLLVRPLWLKASLRDHLAGRTAELLREAGFDPVSAEGKWSWSLRFWAGRKPSERR